MKGDLMKKGKEKKKSHRLLKSFLIILLLLAAALCGAAIWQRDNIKAVIKAQNSSGEEIAGEVSKLKADTQAAIEKYNLPIKRDLTFEEEEEIRKGTLSVEEAISRIMPQETGENAEKAEAEGTDGEGAARENGSKGAANQAQLTAQQQIAAKYLKELYTLKAYYIGQLGVLESDLKAQYRQINGSQKDAAAIAKVVQSNMGRVISLESESDKKVNALLQNMRSELEAVGGDTSIVQIAEDAYVNEKSLRKSYYLSLYN